MKTIEKLFGLSVAVISLTTLITTVAGFLDFPLPRPALWAIGIINLISLPLLIFSTVRTLREKAAAARQTSRTARNSAPAEKAPSVPAGESDSPLKVRPKPHPRQLAAKKAAAGNKPKKGKKKKK